MAAIYRRLRNMRTHFRLLSLGRRSEDGSIRLDMTSHDITGATMPSWRALSYMWGEEKASKSAYVNGLRIDIRPNLVSLLENIWHRSRTDANYRTLYFIDALCIDQSNTSERAAQVMLMPQIFEKAEAVVIWLGHPPPERYTATKKTFCVYDSYLEEFRRWSPVASRIKHPSPWDKSLRWPRPKDVDFEVLEEMLTLPYWERAWIQPEVALARRIRLLYGAFEMLGDTLLALRQTFRLGYHGQRRAVDSRAFKLWYKRLGWEENNLTKNEGRRSGDLYRHEIDLSLRSLIPRDKIYSVRALASNGPELTVSYEESDMDVFLRLLSLEIKSDYFKGWKLAKFSHELVQIFKFKPNQVPQLEQSIRNLGFPRRPSFPTERGDNEGHHLYMVLLVDKWTNAMQIVHKLWTQQKALKAGSMVIPDFLKAQWVEQCKNQPNLERQNASLGWEYIAKGVRALSQVSTNSVFPQTHPLSRATIRGPNSVGLSEVSIAPPLIWTSLCPGGLDEIHAIRSATFRERHQSEAEERLIVDSRGRLGKTSAAVLPGDFLCPLGNKGDAFIIRPLSSEVNLEQQEYEIAGFAFVYRPKLNAQSGYNISVLGKGPCDFNFTFDPMDVLRIGLWYEHFHAMLRWESGYYEPRNTDATPTLEQVVRSIRSGIDL